MKLTIFDLDNWREIGSTLSQNKTRTFMTGFGIFWGTAILAMLLGGADGLKHFMSRNFEGFATNAAAIFPGKTSKSFGGFNKGMPLELNITDVDNIRRSIPQIESSSAVNFNMVTALYGLHKSSAQLTGVEAEYRRIFEPTIHEGRFINESDDANSRKVCVLGLDVARDLFGAASAVGHDVELNGIFYKVVGVVGQTSEINIGAKMDNSVFIPYNSMRKSYNLGRSVDMFMMTFRQGYEPGEFEPMLRRLIASNHPIAPDDNAAFFYFNISERFKMVDNLFIGISLLALFVGVGTLISGVVGVGNIMWIIVRERTHEIGIRRALGAKPADIIIQILSESMVLTVAGGMAGIVLAALVLGAAERLTAAPDGAIDFQLSFGQAVSILATFLTLGTAAGLIPSLKAMRIKPIEALNDK